MSVYLGQDKVGVAYFEKANMYEPNRSIMQDDVYTPWTRPEGWPDLDSLNLEMSGTESFIYMTYRTGHVDDFVYFGWRLISGQSIAIETGNIVNGEFISDTSVTYNSNNTFYKAFDSTSGYSEGTVVIKVTGRFDRFYLKNCITSDNRTFKYYMQPMFERIWYAPELRCFYDENSVSTSGNGTYTIERDKFNNGDGEALVNMYYAWYNCYHLYSLDINGLKTQNVSLMSTAFSNCRQLEYIDVSNFNTAKVWSFSSMFQNCYRMRQLDLRKWNTQAVKNEGLIYIFSGCNALKEILGLENFYTNNLTSLLGVFNNCYSLKDVSGIANWNVGNVTILQGLFQGCFNIKFINLSNWDVSKVTKIGTMFYSCRSLERINFPQTRTATLTGGMASIFYCCYNLQEIDLSWFGPVTNAVTSIGYMFYYCRSVSEINIPEGWDITGCTAAESVSRVFADCYKLQKITGISNWDMSGYNYTLTNQFEYDVCLKKLDIKNWRPHPTSLYYAFYYCESLEEIDLTGWNWENMTGTALQNTFNNCWSLKVIKGIEHMGDSGNCTTYTGTFAGCYSLTTIPNINSWNTSKITSCQSMFASCYSLRSLTITNWSLPKCTTIATMFRYCYNLRELELTGWSLPALTTSPDNIFGDLQGLNKCSGLPINLDHKYTAVRLLPEDQWVRIFTQLPTVSNKKIYLESMTINKLSAATKAIATNKGWTITTA